VGYLEFNDKPSHVDENIRWWEK